MDDIDRFFAEVDAALVDEPEPTPRKKNKATRHFPTDPAVIAARQKVSEAYARLNTK